MRLHRHRYEPIAVYVESFTHGDETRILQRCRCGKVRAEAVRGAWTIEQTR